MSEIIETYQEEEAIKTPAESPFSFGKVEGIGANGLLIKFDGEDATSTKRFLRNSAINFAVGDRVLLQKIDGQYIVCFPVDSSGGFDYVEPGDLEIYIKSADIVDNLTSSKTNVPLSANQGRILKEMIPSLTPGTRTANTGLIQPGSSANSYVYVTNLDFLTGFESNNTSIVVNAYSSGSYIYWRAFNIGNSATSATLTFSYVTD